MRTLLRRVAPCHGRSARGADWPGRREMCTSASRETGRHKAEQRNIPALPVSHARSETLLQVPQPHYLYECGTYFNLGDAYGASWRAFGAYLDSEHSDFLLRLNAAGTRSNNRRDGLIERTEEPDGRPCSQHCVLGITQRYGGWTDRQRYPTAWVVHCARASQALFLPREFTLNSVQRAKRAMPQVSMCNVETRESATFMSCQRDWQLRRLDGATHLERASPEAAFLSTRTHC